MDNNEAQNKNGYVMAEGKEVWPNECDVEVQGVQQTEVYDVSSTQTRAMEIRRDEIADKLWNDFQAGVI
ncbi:unnamed protein product [Linum tenue]|uniref:Uncharacterized protein n=1 Tax=Linum tenue TaxID=586396 RepID=A0AAV0PXV3_9ROSI|nr:unnamed protein product [Linum tenue]